MKLSEFFEYVSEVHKVNTKLLIIISAYNNYQNVKKHLYYLSLQTFKKFNVLLIIGPSFKDKYLKRLIKTRKYPFGCIVAKEKERLGCSGAFFAGQIYALKKKYRYVIFADDDCMPVDKDLIGALYSNKDREYVAPTTIFYVDNYEKKGFVAGPTQYSLFSTKLFLHYGLYYKPLFHGADDGEYMERVLIKPFHIKNIVKHPYIAGMRLFSLFERQWLFLINALIILKSKKALFTNLLVLNILNPIAFCFLPPYGKIAFFTTNILLITHTYGKKAAEKMKTNFHNYVFRSHTLKDFIKLNESNQNYIEKNDIQKFFLLINKSVSFWRRDILIENVYSFLYGFLLSIFAKRIYVKMNKKEYLLLADNSSLSIHLFKIFLFPFIFFLQIITSIFFLLIKFLFQPKTYKYGLELIK